MIYDRKTIKAKFTYTLFGFKSTLIKFTFNLITTLRR
jgi:hypothetical protein